MITARATTAGWFVFTKTPREVGSVGSIAYELARRGDRPRLPRADPTDEDALEELPGAAAGPTIHVARDLVVDAKTGAAKDRRVEIARVVDYDDDRRVRLELMGRVAEHGCHVCDVRSERAATRPSGCGSDLLLPAILQSE